MVLEIWGLGFGFWDLGFGIWVLGFGFCYLELLILDFAFAGFFGWEMTGQFIGPGDVAMQ